MFPWTKLQEKLESLKNGGLLSLVKKVADSEDEKAVELNTEEQLFEKGVDSQNKKLKAYSSSYKRIRISRGQPVDRTTLKNKGDFYKGFDTKKSNKSFDIFSKDSKAKFLEKRYGKNIYGLTPENKINFANLIKAPLLREIKRTL